MLFEGLLIVENVVYRSCHSINCLQNVGNKISISLTCWLLFLSLPLVWCPVPSHLRNEPTVVSIPRELYIKRRWFSVLILNKLGKCPGKAYMNVFQGLRWHQCSEATSSIPLYPLPYSSPLKTWGLKVCSVGSWSNHHAKAKQIKVREISWELILSSIMKERQVKNVKIFF